MYNHFHQIRITYADIDQMGFVYYGNYAKFFEIGRVEAIRNLNFSYKKIEEQNIILPVSTLKIKYLKPAFYDEIITIETQITEIPNGSKIFFTHKIFNEQQLLLCKAEVSLYVLNKINKNTTVLPFALVEAIKKHFL